MPSIQACCDGAFIGHAIASNYDPSISLAVDLSESLLEKKQFDGSDILSRYLFSYHTRRLEIGATTKYIYQIALNNTPTSGRRSSISRQNLLFDSATINKFVQTTDEKFNGNTAGCGPAQRSFPLALCPYIDDDDLFEVSVKEAALTHHDPLAGQVAGIVNLICRSLLRNNTWRDAVQSAFSTPRLHSDISNICMRYTRSSEPYTTTHTAYAPTALNAALYYVTTSHNPTDAIEKACAKDKYYCAPIAGILSGVLWGIPLDMYKKHGDDIQFQSIRDTANKLGNQWTLQPENIVS